MDLQDTLLGHTVLVLGPDQVEIVPEEVCPRRRARGRLTLERPATIGGGFPPSPPDQSERRGGGRVTPSRAPSLRPATVYPTASASVNGICNRQ